MSSFTLDDINEGPIRAAAVELGIPDAATKNKAALIPEIKQRLSPNAPLVFTPQGKVSNAPIVVSILAVIVAALSAGSSWWGTITAVNKNTAELESKSQLQWQTTVVYQIIDEGCKTNAEGLTFNEIRDRYVTAATAENNVRIPKEKLQPVELRAILIGLQADRLVFQLPSDKYIPGKIQPIQGGEALYDVVRATGVILRLVSSRPGEFSPEGLQDEVVKEIKIPKDSFLHAFNSLLVQKGVVLDKNGKAWPATRPPPDFK